MPAETILSIWGRFFADADELSPELARFALRLRVPDEDRDRVAELSAKNGGGALTADERAELEAYSHAAAFLTILQSKARVALRSAATLPVHVA